MATSNRFKSSKKVENALQRLRKEQSKSQDAIYANIISQIEAVNWDNVSNVDKEIKLIFDKNRYEALLTTTILETNYASANLGLSGYGALSMVEGTDDFFLYRKYKGVTLARSIHDSVLQAEKDVSLTVKRSLQNKTTWKRLSKDISLGANTVGDINQKFTKLEQLARKRMIGAASKSEIKALERKIVAAYRYTDTLSSGLAPTKTLKNAYLSVINAVEKKDPVLLTNTMENLFKRKIDYNNDRIARTEMSRAYDDSFNAKLEDDEYITGYYYLLSPDHPVPDICDFYAEVDNGQGAGVYVKGDYAPVPAHPFCLCMKQPYYGKVKGSITKASSEKYLKSIDNVKRSQIIGKSNANVKSKFITALQNKGVDFNAKPDRLPTKLIKKEEV